MHDARRFLNRYPAYVAGVVVVALLVTVGGGVGVGGDDGSSGLPAAMPGALSTPGVAVGLDASTADVPAGTEAEVAHRSDVSGGSAGPAPAGPAAPGRRAAVAGQTPGSAAAPGIGSPAALAGPDCDRASGRIKISFSWRPPCVVPWPAGADNGGATAQGVTAESIRVVRYHATTIGTTSAAEIRAKWATHIELFERFYQLWGRTVENIVVETTGDDEVAQRADAIKIANLKPFLVIGVTAANDVLVTELARRGIVVVTNANASVRQSLQLAPYVWGNLVPPDELVEQNIAEYVGKRLWGRPAKWAGQPDYRVQQRKIAIVHPDTWDLRRFRQAFARYGGELVDAVSYQAGQRYASTWGERSQVIAARLKAKGVTTVIAATDLLFTGPLTHAATGQNWFPEWVTTGYLAQDLTLFARTFNQSQWRNAFGVASIPIVGRVPWPQYWFYDWYWGDRGNSDGPSQAEAVTLFTGLHLAGPNLTPETFRAGLFAFPPTGGASSGGMMTAQLSWGRHGFFPWDDYNGFDDFSEVYWDPTAVAPDLVTGQPTAGNYRHMNGGRRYRMEQWPGGEPSFFDPAGTAIYYEEYPPGDRPPDVPCPADCPSRR